MNHESDPSAPQRASQGHVVPIDDDRRSRRRQRRRQQTAEAKETSAAPQGENYKSELFIMQQREERVRKSSDSASSRPGQSRSPPDHKRTIIRPVSVSAQALIPSTWQDPAERQRKRSGGKMTSSVTSPTRTVTSPTRTHVTSPTRDKRHSLNSPTVPILAGSNFLTINPPSELRVQASPPGGTRAAIHIIDDFLHNPPRTEPLRQRSLSRGGSGKSSTRGSGKQRDREPRTRKTSRSQVTVGLDHLDNLCRLMEQLSSLRDENARLKKRCNFLENTRELLKIQNEMLLNERDDYDSEEEDTLSLGLSESTLAESQIADDDDDVFSHNSSSVIQTSSKPRPQHRRSQSVGSIDIDIMDVLPALEKQHSVPHDSPFTSKFKKSIKHTRNTVKKLFGTKKEGMDDVIIRRVPTITTTYEERQGKISQSSDRSSTSPCQGDSAHMMEHVEALPSPDVVQQAKSELQLQLSEPIITREVVSDDACTPSRHSPSTKRRFHKPSDDALLIRRKSSPTLTFSKEEVTQHIKRPTTPEMPRSCTSPQFLDYQTRYDKVRGRTAWGKVKDIIHTRKDSLKKRNRKSMEENRRSMTDAIFERKSAEPNESPKIEDQTTKASSSSDTRLNELDKPVGKVAPIEKQTHATEAQKAQALQELVGNLSEEFNRKMMEWEKKKGAETIPEKRQPVHVTTSATGSVGDRLSDVGTEHKLRQQRKISHTTSFPVKLRSADGSVSPRSDHPQISLDSLQKGMSDSFNRKMLEWERMRSGQTDGYMSVEGIRRDASWKHRSEKKTKAEKEKLRLERLREKELVKVERERQKLERDRQRLQREHQRTIRRAVELERKKEQLEDLVVESGQSKGHAPLSHHQSYPYMTSSRTRHQRYKYVNVGEYQIEGVSEEFAKRLQTWEEKKHKTKDCFHTWDPQHSTHHGKSQTDVGDIVIPPKFKEGQPPLPIVIRTHQGMPEQLENIHTSPQIVRVEPTYQRATLCTHETQTSPQAEQERKNEYANPSRFYFDDPVTDLRTRNSYLSQQLRQKETERQNLHDDVEGLNRALRRMNESYTKEIASYKHQLWASSHWGQMSEQSKFVAEAVNELRHRVDQLEDLHCREARRRPFSGDSSKGSKDKNNTQGPSETSGRYKNLVDYVKKLHSQISDLKKGVYERDDVLHKFRKHLSLEEINKLLLNADIERRDLELQFFKKKHKHGVIRRHCTFAGSDFCFRQRCDEKPAFKTWPKYRARCVDKIPTTFRHGNFDPESAESDADIAAVLRTCGISSADAEKHQDFLNGNSGVASPRRHLPDGGGTRSIAVQVGGDEDYRHGEDYWSRDDRYRPHGITVHVRRPDSRPHSRESDPSESDSERRSRIDYGRRQMREAFFSSVKASSPTRSLSPNYRQPKTPPHGDDKNTSSFRVRSATYFSPKPYSKTPPNPPEESPHRLEPPSHDAVRRIGPLRKLHSAGELMSERRQAIAGRFKETEVRHSSLMERKSRDDYFTTDISLRRSQLAQQHEMATSQTNIVSGVDVQSIAQTYDNPQDSEAGGATVPSKELPQEGTVRRLTEVFVSGLEPTNGHTARSKYSCERMTDAMQRKRSMEVPKEGTVQKRLGEFVPMSESKSSETSPVTMRKRQQTEVPREGTVQKRLEEFKMFSTDSDRLGPDGKESRKSDSDDTASLLPISRKGTMSSTDEEGGGSKGHSDDEAFTTKISHQSILLRPRPIGGQQRERSKRLSPMEMLVRGTVSLNLDVVSPRYEDEPPSDDPPLSPGGSNTKRRSWFARSFFKSQK